ncbi:MAG: hypothetical protein ABSF90_31335 [Syntrophobacteraceae bacterium]|jgi:hypothetical protein
MSEINRRRSFKTPAGALLNNERYLNIRNPSMRMGNLRVPLTNSLKKRIIKFARLNAGDVIAFVYRG